MKEKLLILIGRIGKEARVGKITTKVQSNVLLYSILFISLYLTKNFSFLGSLSNNNGDINKNSKKEIGLDLRNNNFECASHFFVHFFAVTAQLRRKNAQFHDLSGMGTQDNNFPFLSLNFDKGLSNSTPKNFSIFDELNEME